MKNLFFLSICCLLLLSACKKDKNVSGIYQEWTWVRSTGGIAGITMTPATEGYTMSIKFIEDTKTYIEYRDGVEYLRYRIELSRGNSIFEAGTQDLLDYFPAGSTKSTITESVWLNGNNLSLKEECNDCFERVFVKK